MAAHGDAELAERLAYGLAHDLRGPLYDLSGLADGSGPMRYSATGEVVTPESEARYAKMAESSRAASLALYNQERAKGTPPADIFDKLIALGDTQHHRLGSEAWLDLLFAANSSEASASLLEQRP